MTTANPPERPVVGHVVTLAQIYELLISLQQQLSNATKTLEERADDIRDHESRLRSLESGRWPIKQVMAATAVGSLLLGLFGLVIAVVMRTL